MICKVHLQLVRRYTARFTSGCELDWATPAGAGADEAVKDGPLANRLLRFLAHRAHPNLPPTTSVGSRAADGYLPRMRWERLSDRRLEREHAKLRTSSGTTPGQRMAAARKPIAELIAAVGREAVPRLTKRQDEARPAPVPSSEDRATGRGEQGAPSVLRAGLHDIDGRPIPDAWGWAHREQRPQHWHPVEGVGESETAEPVDALFVRVWEEALQLRMRIPQRPAPDLDLTLPPRRTEVVPKA